MLSESCIIQWNSYEILRFLNLYTVDKLCQNSVLTRCTGTQELTQKAKQKTTAKQWLPNKKNTMVIPLCTGTKGHSPKFFPVDLKVLNINQCTYKKFKTDAATKEIHVCFMTLHFLMCENLIFSNEPLKFYSWHQWWMFFNF